MNFVERYVLAIALFVAIGQTFINVCRVSAKQDVLVKDAVVMATALTIVIMKLMGAW